MIERPTACHTLTLARPNHSGVLCVCPDCPPTARFCRLWWPSSLAARPANATAGESPISRPVPAPGRPPRTGALFSALPTLTALRASTASAVLGQSVTFTATVSDLSPGGATPNGGTVTFSDPGGAIGSETLANGVAAFTTSSLAAGANTVTASYGGTADFAPSTTGTIVTAAGNGKAGYRGNNGPATAAELNGPVASPSTPPATCSSPTLQHVVREVVKATGDIITVAGNGTAGYSGDNGPATAAEMNNPSASPSTPRATCSSPT